VDEDDYASPCGAACCRACQAFEAAEPSGVGADRLRTSHKGEQHLDELPEAKMPHDCSQFVVIDGADHALIYARERVSLVRKSYKMAQGDTTSASTLRILRDVASMEDGCDCL
jgi:hypothetical protein